MVLKYFILVLIIAQCSNSAPGDPVMFFPPLEVRAARTERPFLNPYGNPQFRPTSQNMMVPQHQSMMHMDALPQHQSMMHMDAPHQQHQQMRIETSPSIPPPQHILPHKPQENTPNITLNDFFEALTKMDDHRTENHPDSRSSDFSPHLHSPYSHLHGYPQKGYGTLPTDSTYQAPAQPYEPPADHPSEPTMQPKADLISSLLSPITTKDSGKLSGLLGLILSLFGSSTGSSLLTAGFKSIVEGIVKPLLAAKGGLKSLISKLAIPVIALLLINVEVLITWWWLWEDCPEEAPHPTHYEKPVYTTNSYS